MPAADDRSGLARDGRRCAELRPQGRKLVRAGKLAVEQQVGDLLVRGVPGEIVDVVATEAKDALLAVDRAELGPRHDDPFQPAFCLAHSVNPTRWPVSGLAHQTPSAGAIDPSLVFRR